MPFKMAEQVVKEEGTVTVDGYVTKKAAPVLIALTVLKVIE